VPTKIFNASLAEGHHVTRGAPVLVWIYGGGYTEGDKTSSGSPASLIARSQLDGSEGVIFVTMNYRLGLFVRHFQVSQIELMRLGMVIRK
jgi:carboxylesterase type B